MKLGVFGVNVGAMASTAAGALARMAEDLGYDSLWAAEHMALPKPRRSTPPLDPDWPMADPLVMLGHLAAFTSRVELCTGVLILPLRQPIQLAKEAATLDVLCGGRLVLGLGLGYLPEEFTAAGVPTADVRRRFREHLRALQSLWTMESPSFRGEFVEFAGIDAYPRPVQTGGPRLVLGGHSPQALRDAAEFGGGWYGFGCTPEEAGRAREQIRRHADEIGRDLSDFRITVTPPVQLTAGLAEGYARAGAQQVVVSVESRTVDGVRRRLEKNAPGRLGF